LKNSFTIYVRNLINRFFTILLNYKLNVVIGYNTYINNVIFSYDNVIHDNCFISNCKIGQKTYISSNSKIKNCIIGSFCSIGQEVHIGLPKHPINEFISTHPYIYTTYNLIQNKSNFITNSSTIIGNDVWIGNRVTIIGDIEIGNGAIIAAGSIVTKNVLPYSIVGGVPAKHLKFRFDEDRITKIEEMNWWNWTDADIAKNTIFFKLDNI
jgi:acetyltransferase-like isoleucine patch superfamily enzyme